MTTETTTAEAQAAHTLGPIAAKTVEALRQQPDVARRHIHAVIAAEGEARAALDALIAEHNLPAPAITGGWLLNTGRYRLETQAANAADLAVWAYRLEQDIRACPGKTQDDSPGWQLYFTAEIAPGIVLEAYWCGTATPATPSTPAGVDLAAIGTRHGVVAVQQPGGGSS